MQYDNVESFAKLLKLSISPVFLISAVGLLLFSLNNRLARIIDRTRELANDIQNSGGKNLEELRFELKVMFNRSHILRAVITLVSPPLTLFMMRFLGFRNFAKCHFEIFLPLRVLQNDLQAANMITIRIYCS